ncbi:unnamed protein product [Prunus brigantina]
MVGGGSMGNRLVRFEDGGSIWYGWIGFSAGDVDGGGVDSVDRVDWAEVTMSFAIASYGGCGLTGWWI